MIYDMHSHTNFYADESLADRKLADRGVYCLHVGVLPGDNLSLCRSNRALGLHPWYIDRTEDLLEQFIKLSGEYDYIGEVGLDFAKNRRESIDQQICAFEKVLQHSIGARAISVHCYNADDILLDMIDDALRGRSASFPAVILHWFSGSGLHLQRAIQLGCYFSYSERALRSAKCREYAKAVPLNKLMIESDMPSECSDGAAASDVDEQATMLQSAEDLLCELKNCKPQDFAATSKRVLGHN